MAWFRSLMLFSRLLTLSVSSLMVALMVSDCLSSWEDRVWYLSTMPLSSLSVVLRPPISAGDSLAVWKALK
ncbi:hypothetical protein D3C85_1414120 [compost metagenome]